MPTGLRLPGRNQMATCGGRVTTDSGVRHGQACIRGTRIPVAMFLDNLAFGLTQEEIVASYPSLQKADVPASLGYAAEIAREVVIELDVTEPEPLART